MSEPIAIPLRTRATLILKGVLLGALISSGGAGYLYLQMNTQRVALLQVIDDAKEAISTSEAKTLDERERSSKDLTLLRALLGLYRADHEVEAMNYGTARDLAQEATTSVSTLKLNDPTLYQALANVQITPEDPLQSRETLRTAERALSAVVVH